MWALDFIFKKITMRHGIYFSFLLLFIMGFRVYPTAAKWNVSPSAPKLWVSFCKRPAITSNDLPKGDPLFGQSLNFTNVTQSVFDDYNNIGSSFIRLYDADTDPTFSTSDTTNHIVKICFGEPGIGFGGVARPKLSNGQVIGCEITLLDSLTSSGKTFVHTLTHELGHCVGLDHPQDTNFAIMSYFNVDTRLQADDKMGVTYLYPVNSSYNQESPTLGFSCSPK